MKMWIASDFIIWGIRIKARVEHVGVNKGINVKEPLIF